MMPKKCVAYVRVSTQEQTQGYSLGNQRDRIKEFVKARDGELTHIYQDDGYSAKSMKRPGLYSSGRDTPGGKRK